MAHLTLYLNINKLKVLSADGVEDNLFQGQVIGIAEITRWLTVNGSNHTLYNTQIINTKLITYGHFKGQSILNLI